uniref:Uncharacterized protein n=1 Tax=Triticum urartu TaxID=4572 RepID=A0A8R7UTM1_TRIUA
MFLSKIFCILGVSKIFSLFIIMLTTINLYYTMKIATCVHEEGVYITQHQYWIKVLAIKQHKKMHITELPDSPVEMASVGDGTGLSKFSAGSLSTSTSSAVVSVAIAAGLASAAGSLFISL